MAGETNFRVRMSVEGADQMMATFRKAAEGSADVKRAFDQLIQASPQLASAADGVRVKVDEAARAMKAKGEAARDLTGALKQTAQATIETGTGFSSLGTILQGAAFGGAAGVAASAVAVLADKLSAAYQAIPVAGDAVKLLGARLESATGSALLAADVLSRLRQTAAATGSSLEDSATAFSSFSVAARSLGASNDQVLALVGGLQKFAVISGTGPQQAAAATLQMSQALASGRFQGDELRSVMENMPQLAEALAKQLGYSTGQLRQLGSEGKLTADVVFPALLRAVQGVDEKFAAMPSNMQRSMNAAKIALDDVLSALDKAFGFSDAIAKKWDRIAEALRGFRSSALPTAGERLVSGRDAAAADLARLEADRAADAAKGLTPGQNGYMLGGVTDQQIDRARAALKAWETELTNFRRENRELRNAELGDNRSNALGGALGRAQAEADDWIKAHDKIAKAKADYEASLASIDRQANAITSEEATRRRAIALKEYNEALQKASGTQKEAADTTNVLAEAMDKLRAKQDERFAAIQTSLDPYAAALKRQADALATLAEAETAYATSDGARGIDPEKVADLRTKAAERYAKEIEGINRKADDTGRAFDQFFSRATSGFEDAIVKGKSFGDVVKGLEGDMARLILRLTILDPLSKGLSGAIGGAGGIGGLFSSAFSWFSGGSSGSGTGAVAPASIFTAPAFANGGIMTDRGPLPLRRYAGGGIADTPQIAMFGEGRQPEAYVPLPDGRRIPVAMQGGGGGFVHAPTITINTTSDNPAKIAALVEAAADRANQKLVADIARNGPMARVVGRRR